MSAALLAVIIALSLGHFLPQLASLRRYGPLWAWHSAVLARIGTVARDEWSGVLLVLVVPALLLALLLAGLARVLFGLPEFVLSVFVLFLCWGPRDLDRDLDALRLADDPVAVQRATMQLGAPAAEGAELVPALFRAALSRWFGVLFWFLVLGAPGALLYRWQRLLAEEMPPRGDSPRARLQTWLDWPAAQLMTLALAIAANFDAVFHAWRDWHRARGHWWVADIGFLDAAARTSVTIELAEAAEEAEVAPPADAVIVAPTPHGAAVRDAQSLIWRLLIVWLTVLALFVLAGITH